MNDMKLSGYQTFWLIATMQTGMAILLTVTPAIQAAQQDGWVSMLLASAITAFVIYCSVKVSILYPQMTLVQYVPLILGKWLGHLVIFAFLLYLYVVLSIILHQYSTAIVETLLPQTPRWIPVIGLMLVLIYISVSGVSVIGRFSELTGPFIMIGIALTLILSFAGARLLDLLPLYPEKGWFSLVQGALPPAGFLGDSVLLVMLTAFVQNPRTAMKPAIWSAIVAGTLTALTTADVVATFGPQLSSSMVYPYFLLVRNISIAEVVQNLDSVFISIWIVSVFTKCSIYLFAAGYGTAQWLGIRNWRGMIGLVALVVTVLAMLPLNFVQTSILFPKKIVVPFILPIIIVGIPLLLVVVGTVRKGAKNQNRV